MKMNNNKLRKILAFMICLLLLAPGLVYAADVAELYVFFKDLCDDCHGATPKHAVLWARAGYDQSGHKNNGNALYANGGGCQKCHTNEGFIEYVAKGKVNPKTYIKFPSQPNCNTCHDPHKKGDLSLRTNAPVTLADGTTFDMGSGNLCANCHQVRGKAAESVKATPAKKIRGHWGAHHGPQADMLVGTNAFEFKGKTYYSSVHSTLIKDGCVVCHMSYPKKRYSFSPGLSGHSFRVATEIHEREKLNTSGCLSQNCHAKMKQAKGKDIFAMKAKADFDNDGKVEPIQAEVDGLLELFVNKNGTGYLQKLDPPMYKTNGKWNQVKSDKKRSLKEMAALYNYKFVLEEKSRGIHNAPYTIQVLYDTLEVLDPGFDTSKRNVYKPPEEYKPREATGGSKSEKISLAGH